MKKQTEKVLMRRPDGVNKNGVPWERIDLHRGEELGRARLVEIAKKKVSLFERDGFVSVGEALEKVTLNDPLIVDKAAVILNAEGMSAKDVVRLVNSIFGANHTEETLSKVLDGDLAKIAKSNEDNPKDTVKDTAKQKGSKLFGRG